MPADTAGTLTLDGAASNLTLSPPGRNGSFTFTAASGQSARVRVTGNTIGTLVVTIAKPWDTPLSFYLTTAAGSFDLPLLAIPSPDIYTITIDPQGAATGSMNVQVTSGS